VAEWFQWWEGRLSCGPAVLGSSQRGSLPSRPQRMPRDQGSWLTLLLAVDGAMGTVPPPAKPSMQKTLRVALHCLSNQTNPGKRGLSHKGTFCIPLCLAAYFLPRKPYVAVCKPNLVPSLRGCYELTISCGFIPCRAGIGTFMGTI
jgi:hypothetical protein